MKAGWEALGADLKFLRDAVLVGRMKTCALLSGGARRLAWGVAVLGVVTGMLAQVRDVPGPALIEEGAREKPVLMEVTFLGVSTHRVDAALAEKMKLPRTSGLLVARVMAGSPAEGLLKPQDLLTQFEGEALSDPRQLGVLVRARKGGEVVRVELVREGKPLTVRVILGRREMPPLPEARPPVLP